MRAFFSIMLCLSFIGLRGQEIAKIVMTTGAGVQVQEGSGTIHFVFDDLFTGYAKEENNTQIFAGFLTPVFFSRPTPTRGVLKSSLKIVPNPFTDRIRFQAESTSGPVTYLLFDVNGHLFKSGKGLASEIEINGRHLVPGMYLLRIHYPDGQFEIHKLIKL